MPLRFVTELPPSRAGRPIASTPSWGAEYIPELKTRPNQWAEVTTDNLDKDKIHQRAAAINRGYGSWRCDNGRFRASVRTKDGQARLYLRYETDH